MLYNSYLSTNCNFHLFTSVVIWEVCPRWIRFYKQLAASKDCSIDYIPLCQHKQQLSNISYIISLSLHRWLCTVKHFGIFVSVLTTVHFSESLFSSCVG